MNRALILFAHPRFEKSRANRTLLSAIRGLENVTLHDLYEEYPDFSIDVEREKSLLLDHGIIIWQHPFHNYGPPALLKQWIDLVLDYGWAHGPGGTHLRNKICFNTVTAGGTRNVYTSGLHRFTIREFLASFEQTAHLCGMVYLPPFVVHGTFALGEKELRARGELYRLLLDKLTSGECRTETVRCLDYLSDWSSADDPQVLP